MSAEDPVTRLICLALFVYWIVLLLRVVVSWLEYFGVRVPVSGPGRSAHDLLIDVTEPPLRPLRKIVPPAGRFDLSMLVLFVIVLVLRQAIC